MACQREKLAEMKNLQISAKRNNKCQDWKTSKTSSKWVDFCQFLPVEIKTPGYQQIKKQPGVCSDLVEVHLLAQPGPGAALGYGLEDLQPVSGTRKAHVEDLVQSAGP